MLFISINMPSLFSQTLLQIGRRDRSVVFNTRFVVFFVNWYEIYFFFHSDGKIPCVRQVLEKIKDLKLDLSDNLSIRILIISSTWTLFESSLLMLLISSIEKSTYEKDLSIIKEKSDSNVLPLSFNEHCFVKKELRFRSFLWSQTQIFYLEKVVEYRVFFYHLKESLVEFNNIWDKWLD